MNAIECNNLSKSFGNVQALRSVSFSVNEGEVFGLIGPDGAGKTTLFRLLVTLLVPDSGSASVDGCDIVRDSSAIRARVGYMPGRFSLYPDLTVEENLNFFAALFGVGVESSYELIAPIYRQIEPFKRRRAGKLSGGMKQKLALCCALIHRPRVLFLDEPTTGVDAVSRSEFWDMLSELKQKGISILVSTPYMDEASRCDRIALCNDGRIMGIGTPQGFVEKFSVPVYGVRADDMYGLLLRSREMNGVDAAYPFGVEHHLFVNDDFDMEEFASALSDLGGLSVRPVVPGIEDVFINLMKNG